MNSNNLKTIFIFVFVLCLIVTIPTLFINRIVRKVTIIRIKDSTYQYLKYRSDSLINYSDSITKINLYELRKK